VTLEEGDRVLVTGAAGFIGSAITRALLDRAVHVVALTEPGADQANLDGLDVEIREADIRRERDVQTAAAGARYVIHTAALFSFWAKDPDAFYDVNVHGTRNVLAAAQAVGSERIVYTSTVATIGLDGTNEGLPADETVHARLEDLHGHYKRTKYVAEHEVLRAAAQGAPVTLVHPTFPLGPRDRRPTPTGKVVLDFLNGRMPGFVDTAMNVEHVDDLAAGHLLALERGATGRSYILGGENVSMERLLELLAECTGLTQASRRFPRRLALVAGAASQMIEGRLLGREPHVPLEAAQMSLTKMVFDDSRARRELGYTSRPTREAIESSARWFAANGYVRSERLAQMTWPTT
jgi:dihydroflavonol-4-reductase